MDAEFEPKWIRVIDDDDNDDGDDDDNDDGDDDDNDDGDDELSATAGVIQKTSFNVSRYHIQRRAQLFS